MSESVPAFHKIAILGASGKLGRCIVEQLLSKKQYDITAITRESSTASFPAEVKVVKTADDYSAETMVPALQGQDVAIIAFNIQSMKYHKSVVDSAVTAGVKRLLPAHWGSNAENAALQQLSPRIQNLDAEVDYIKSRVQDGLTWTTIVPGLFFDYAFPNTFLGFRISTSTAIVWGEGTHSFSVSTHRQIARTVAAVLEKPAHLTMNQYVYTSSFETSQRDMLACVERVTGAPWTVRKADWHEKVQRAAAVVETGDNSFKGMIAQGTLALAAAYGGEAYQSDFVKSGRSWNQKLGLEEEKIDEVVSALIQSDDKMGEVPDSVLEL